MNNLLSPQEIAEVFTRFRAHNENPKSELRWTSPFTLLVAVVLSAQATDKSVNLATQELYKVADTPEKILALGEAGLITKLSADDLYNFYDKEKQEYKSNSLLWRKKEEEFKNTLILISGTVNLVRRSIFFRSFELFDSFFFVF